LVISAAGAVNEDELLALAERCFGDAGGAPAPAAPPARFAGGLRPVARRLEQAHLVFLLPGPGACDADYYVGRVFVEALGGGMSSRLFQEAREKRGLAYSIDAWADNYTDIGVIGVYAGAAAGNAGELARVAAGEMRSLAANASADELARAKAQLTAHLFMAREAPLVRAEQAAGQALLFGRLFTPTQVAEGIEAVTAQDIARLGERMLAAGTCAASVLGPKAALSAAESFQRALFN
jgi:predicted Zn-dependent peptidase